MNFERFYTVAEIAEKFGESYEYAYNFLKVLEEKKIQIPKQKIRHGKRNYHTVGGSWVLHELQIRLMRTKEKAAYLEKQFKLTQGEMNHDA